jgi:hypothetical protein
MVFTYDGWLEYGGMTRHLPPRSRRLRLSSERVGRAVPLGLA